MSRFNAPGGRQAESLPQKPLHGPLKIEQPEKHERHHVSGQGERQHQCPIEPASPRELASADQPGQADSENQRTNRDAEDQQ